MLLVTESLTLIAGKREPAFLVHLIEALDAGRRLLGDALDAGLDARVEGGILGEPRPDRVEQRRFLFVGRMRNARRVLLGPGAEVDEQRGIATVIEDHVRPAAAFGRRPFEDPVGVVPVIDQRLALARVHGRAAYGDRGGGVVLRRVDVARRPAHLRAQRLQRLDQHGRLDRHVQGAGDARAAQRLLRGEFLADRHEAGHLGLGDRDLLAPPVGECQVGDGEVGKALGIGCGVHRSLHRW